ncbi:50S ribosomal protein L2 [Nanoarchaeota archaeon]
MGRPILQQRRGRGSPTFKTKRYAYRLSANYPKNAGEGVIQKFISLAGMSTPLVKIKLGKEIFFNIATKGLEEGQKIKVGEDAEIKTGNILPLAKIPLGTEVCNIETIPNNGGKLVRSSGISATVLRRTPAGVILSMPSRKEKLFSKEARATVGVTAGSGRTDKPWMQAGPRVYAMKAKNKHYPRTSPIKRNAVDHPFGSGRGKNMGKSGIAPRWAPPGRKVGLIRPRKTGRGGKK